MIKNFCLNYDKIPLQIFLKHVEVITKKSGPVPETSVQSYNA